MKFRRKLAVKLEYETLAEFMKRIQSHSLVSLVLCPHIEVRDAVVLPWK